MSPPVPMRPLDVFSCALDGINLIEASAGTGKTWNICALYLRLLLERRLEVQRILVVTFTNAATAELRSRIRTRIVETLAYLDQRAAAADPFVAALVEAVSQNAARSPAEMSALLEAALQTFDEAAIFTIHGFCQRALAETPFAAGLPFGIELMEDDAELRREAVADFWRRNVSAAPLSPALAGWLARNADSPQSWSELLARVQAKPLSQMIWPGDLDEMDDPDEAGLAAAFEAAREIWAANGSAATTTILARLAALNANSYKADAVRQGETEWERWFAGGDPLTPEIALDGKTRLFRAGFLAARTKKNESTPTHPFFDAAEALLALREQTEARLERLRLRLLRDMLHQAGPLLRAKKRERRLAAFDDILYNAFAALRGGAHPWLAASLRRRYPAALIDEFQDTDPLQFAVFDAIYGSAAEGCAAGPLFLVGDPKQAIYSFRNADLHTYLQAKRRAGICHTLADNQRSVEGLIVACNRLFGANPNGFVLPGIDYQEVHLGAKPRQPFVDRSQAGTGPAVLRIWHLPRDADGRHLLRDQARERAVQATAAEVARLVREGAAQRITVGGRGLLAGDIAVLVKSHAQGSLIKQALGALGIGSVELSREGIFATPDAQELERVLLAIAEPGHPVRLLAAFATELMGRDAQAVLALSRDEGELLRAVARFTGYRDAWLERGFGFMLRQWTEAEGVARRLLARADGERRLTNLLHLGELLHQAAVSHAGAEALLRWLADRRREAVSSEEAQLRLESDRNLVQIVTIHKAKGLEYEVVFCPFLWDGLQVRRGEPEGREYHDDEGNGIFDFRPEAAADEEIKRRRREEADAEFVRLAYVALTRAVHRCYLVAGCYLFKAGRGDPSLTQSTRSLLNWLVAGGDLSHEEWCSHKLGPDTIEAAWQRIAREGAPHVALADLPDAPGEPVAGDVPSPEALSALPPPSRLPEAWRIGSFSSLQHGAEHEAAAADHDARAQGRAEAGPAPELPAQDILRFARGPSAGDCLHAVFERADFTDPASWDGAIERALAVYPQRLRGINGDAAAALQRAMLRGMLADVLATPVHEGVVLRDVPGNRRLTELGFNLSAGEITAARLNGWLKDHGYPMPRLNFAPLDGYLKGYIDLVFEAAGRYYILDWKSNHLGYAQEDYAEDRLALAMQQHGYHLQYLLYAVALHRYLGRRLPDYDYERDFGGVLYLFVRGVRPGWTDGAGRALGTWFHRPAAAAIAALDALLAGSAAAIAT